MGYRAAERANLPRRMRTAVFLLGCILVSGCASTEYARVRRIPRNPLAGPLQLLSRKGPQATPRTVQLLRRYDVSAATADKKLARLSEELKVEPTAGKVHALAELAYIHGKRLERSGQRDRALDLFTVAVAHAYQYLFDPAFDSVRNPYDPQFRGACDLYNGALESVLRTMNERGRLQPGKKQIVTTSEREYQLDVVVRGPWHSEDFERLEFASDYQVSGLTNRHESFGLGVPLIAVRRSHEGQHPAEKFYPPGLSFAVTAFLRVGDHSQAGSRQCVLELHDPLVGSDIMVAQRRVPLETDLTTPLAYFLDNRAFAESRNAATLGLLNPNRTQKLQGLYMMEPYDPRKIPVLMVHGLWSSPVTWMEMFNDLRSFPEVRDRYQFWFYLYPTGQPFWLSATQLRRDLHDVRELLRKGKPPVATLPAAAPPALPNTLDQMVLVGHSMGGLVSNLQVIHSGEEFWQIISDRPFDELKAEPETRRQVAENVFFEPNRSVRRVVTIGTPHRGSSYANDYTRWLGRRLITLPALVMHASQSLIRDNPEFFRNTHLLTTTTSIDALAPDSPVLPVLRAARKARWVKRHNIAGVVDEQSGLFARLSARGDGVVPFTSAHLDDVQTELIVPADHLNAHQHPRAILEVRRILLQHSAEMWAETRHAQLNSDEPGRSGIGLR